MDILLAHAPAYQLGDDTDLCHTGFSCFVSFMDKYRPKYFIHGHVHQSYKYDFKRVREYKDTQIINAYKSYYLDYPD